MPQKAHHIIPVYLRSPREPKRLAKDIKEAMTYIEHSEEMFNLLIAYIDTYVDPIDRPGLMPVERPLYPTQKDAAKLWTRVLWYTMCHDYAAT